MKVNKLLIAAVLVIAIGSPIAGFVGHIKLPLSTTPTGEPVAFFSRARHWPGCQSIWARLP